MKKITILFLVLSIAVISTGSGYATQVSNVLDLQATVGGNCTISADPINFGVVTGETNVFASSALHVMCPLGVSYEVSFGGGEFLGFDDPTLRALGVDPTGFDFVAYDLTYQGSMALGTNCNPGAPVPFPDGGCIQGTGSSSVDIFLIDAELYAFSGIPIGTILWDSLEVTVLY